ncbi:MAG: DAHL domain-containing protein [Myxococcota bacterium]
MKELRRHLVAVLLAAAVTVTLTLLFRAAQDRDAEQHSRATAELRDVRELDAQLDALVLQARFALLPNYDRLVQTLAELARRTGALRQDVMAHALSDPAVDAALQALESDVTEKGTLVEDIKSSSSVFRNSSSYLPRALGEVEGTPGAGEKLDTLQRATLRAMLTPDTASAAELEEVTRRILLEVTDPDTTYPELARAARHARMMSARRQALAELITRYLALDSAAATGQLATAYQQFVTAQRQRSELFRVVLYVVSVLLALYVAITLIRMARLNASARRFVPYEFLQLLGKRTLSDVERGDSVQQEMTVLFSDIRSFANMSARLTPQENFRFINAYLEAMEPAIHGYMGVVNQYLGDGIMALFPRDADDGVRGALAMSDALRQLNLRRVREGLVLIRAGIGVNSGRVMLGTIGGCERMDCGVVGDAVNLASRVEGLTKVYGTELLITQATRERLRDPARFSMRTVDRVLVKGAENPITVYEVWNPRDPSRAALDATVLGRYEDALGHYRARRFEEAGVVFRACLEQVPDDPLFKLYAQRCERLQREAPPEDWAGVLRMETK